MTPSRLAPYYARDHMQDAIVKLSVYLQLHMILKAQSAPETPLPAQTLQLLRRSE